MFASKALLRWWWSGEPAMSLGRLAPPMPDAFGLPTISSLFLREGGTGELSWSLLAEAVLRTLAVLWGEAGVVAGCCCGCAMPLGSRLSPQPEAPRAELLRLLFFFFFDLAALSLPFPEPCSGGSPSGGELLSTSL